MKDPRLRFQTAQLAEVINKPALEAMGNNVERLIDKEGPYAVHQREERPKGAHSRRAMQDDRPGASGQRQSGGTVPVASMLESKRPKRFFVVDDEQCIADTLTAILRRSGYEATALYDGESAWSACNNKAPDLIISDVVMPGISGIDLAIRIRERYPNCKVLLFSGMAASADLLEDARRQGYDFEVLAKPVHPADLLSRIAA